MEENGSRQEVVVSALQFACTDDVAQGSSRKGCKHHSHSAGPFSVLFCHILLWNSDRIYMHLVTWEVALLTFAVVPLILITGATYTKKMNAFSTARMHYLSEATSMVEQV